MLVLLIAVLVVESGSPPVPGAGETTREGQMPNDVVVDGMVVLITIVEYTIMFINCFSFNTYIIKSLPC